MRIPIRGGPGAVRGPKGCRKPIPYRRAPRRPGPDRVPGRYRATCVLSRELGGGCRIERRAGVLGAVARRACRGARAGVGGPVAAHLHRRRAGRPRPAACPLQATGRGSITRRFAALAELVVRRREDAQPLGTVQATVSENEDGLTAQVAWVIDRAHQGQGYAWEAGGLMVRWLRQQGVDTLVAHVHPQHDASMAVSRAVGLTPTETVIDGEVRWEA